jgi:solute:Na+ symporter, SSS family
VRHDLAYPAMLVFLPPGLLGLVVASLAAAYMSTISTHLNWGASYVVDDVYRRFSRRRRTSGTTCAWGAIATVALIVLASAVALWLENALQAFQILLQIGAGTGLVFLLRWFWWRINVWSELSAMVISFVGGRLLPVRARRAGIHALGRVARARHRRRDHHRRLAHRHLPHPPHRRRDAAPFHERIQPLGPGWRARASCPSATAAPKA